MSTYEVKQQIENIQKRMAAVYIYYDHNGLVSTDFLSDVSLLHQKYGAFLGKAMAKYPGHIDEVDNIDSKVRDLFEKMTSNSDYRYCFKLVSSVMQNMCRLVSFVETLETLPPEEKVTRIVYEKLVDENKGLKKAIELVRSMGPPELNSLLETAKEAGLETDENWVLALCSANLIEAIVNKKLEKLDERIEGNFENRYKKLLRIIKEREDRDISQLLPLALYSGIRNKLDHASHSNRVTAKEARDISEIVRRFIGEVFQ